MNTTSLIRQYDALTPWERLPLIVAAAGRGDDVEENRLAQTAPRVDFRVANCWGLVQGLELLARHYLLVQLDRAVIYWRVMNLLDKETLFGQTRKAKQREERLWRALETLAYRIVVQADGWKLFCRQMQIDPEVPLKYLPGHEAVSHVETLARNLACTPEEACVRLREAVGSDKSLKGNAPPDASEFRLDTADEVARFMRKVLEAQRNTWS
jgi:hypothetical protein